MEQKVYRVVVKYLRNMVKSGSLSYGDKLPSERTLSVELGVSRSAVREAIRGLELNGIVECRQGEGNYIVEDIGSAFVEPIKNLFDLEGCSLSNVLELRRCLEVEAATLLVDFVTEDIIKELQLFVDVIDSDKTRLEEKVNANEKFHLLIAESCGNMFIKSLLESISLFVDNELGEGRKVLMERSTIKIMNNQHNSIIEGLQKGDKDYLSREMRRHLDYVKKLSKGK